MCTPASRLDVRVPLHRQIRALQYNCKETSDRVEAHESHDADDDAPVDKPHGDTEQEEADRDLDKADCKEVDGLGNEVELVAVCEVGRWDVLLMASGTIADFGDDDDLAYDALW